MSYEKKAKKLDYNIEYAHIYADEHFGTEHKKSVEELHKIITKLKQSNKSYVLSVLIDEYNSIRHTLNIKNFLKKLEQSNSKPDFIGFESRLVKDKDSLLKEMSKKIRKEYEEYIIKQGKIPCSFLIALWYLKRLGLLNMKGEELHSISKENKPFIAREIITILPKRYQAIEIKALKIIKSTKFKKYLKNIKNIFFDNQTVGTIRMK